jgi:uncharacterized membrane protein|tara:strand:+ start:136 stop:360 length:225 start_codon:yes stop_codon:yes gene_type:complete
MGFTDIFKDDNDINEKSVVGFASFAIMILVMLIDIITGWFGHDLVVNEFIYNSFTVVTLGCFGISGIEKFAGKK